MAKRVYYQALARLETVGAEGQKQPLSGKQLKPLKNTEIRRFRFGRRDLRKFANGFYVYLWRRGNVVLYVGSSLNVASRLSYHHAVGIKEPFGESDHVEVRVYQSRQEMLRSESALIRQFRPKHNIAQLREPTQKPQRFGRSKPTAKTLWLVKCLARQKELRQGEHARA